jgi:chromosome segregation ATPase
MTNIIQIETILAEIRELAKEERPGILEEIGDLLISHEIVEDLSEELEEAEAELSRIDVERMDLANDNEKLEEVIEILKSEAEELEKDKKFLADEIDALKQDLRDSRFEIYDLNERILDLEPE